jgi:hypothetical protein
MNQNKEENVSVEATERRYGRRRKQKEKFLRNYYGCILFAKTFSAFALP